MSDWFADNLFRKQYTLNRARGVYYNGKTYVVYQDPDSDPRIKVFDHAANNWSSDYWVGESIITNTDDHGNPGIAIDATGRVHVVYGGHGTQEGEMRHRVSVNPGDITSWKDGGALPEIHSTYPGLFTLANGTLVLTYRGRNSSGTSGEFNQHKADWYCTVSTDNGNSWSTPVAFLRGTENQSTDDTWYVYSHAKGNELHIGFVYHQCADSNHQAIRRNIYYMKRSADGSWSDAAGNSLSLPITQAAANDTTNNKIRVYVSGSANTQYPSVDVDSNGKPFISFGKEESGGVRKYCASWTGSSWNVRSVAFHSNNKETRTTLLHRGGDDFSLFGFGTNGRDLLEYKTTDGNTSWTFVKKVWSGVFDDPCVIWQSHNNAYLFFDDAAGTIRHGYLYGDAGFVGSNGITGGIVSTARWSLKANNNQRMSFIYLSGSARADVLRGSPKSEFLFGGAGEDKLVGRGGRDIVIGGTDDDKLFGNDGKDILQGGAGRDLLFGGAGKDKLNGGVGNDVLVGDFGDDRLNGGGGKDQFQYQTVQSFSKARFDQDTIADFTHGLDEIILGKGTFTALSSRTGKGFSHPHEFARVTRDIEAFTSGSLIVYNSETGKLFYNQNGIAAGLGNGGHFATLVGHPTLTASDFVLSAASNLF